MAIVVDYDYITELSTEESKQNLASDVSSWYNSSVPWLNTNMINAETKVVNIEEPLSVAGWNTDVKWTPWIWTIAWSSGNVNLPDWTVIPIQSWSATVTADTYIYVNTKEELVYSTTIWVDAVWKDKILLCVAYPNPWKDVSYKAFGCADQSSLVTGDAIDVWAITYSLIADRF